uniref:Uncharacterized protein n=1 Tax=Kalmanozyma brasiliensis (strain GHG001) TaxID=1365824 RepID=V5EB80_KALBG
MASAIQDQDPSSSSSSEASTSYKSRLPDKKTFIATLSGGAFVVGLTGATIYGLRKAKLQALKEAQKLAEVSQSGSLARATASAGVGLSLKAFFIATSIVTFSTLATLELTKWALGVKTMDEFVIAMTKIIPSRARGEGAQEGAAPHMRVQRDACESTSAASEAAAAPKSVDQALTDLSNATSFEEWVSTLRNQLDSERDFEVSRRFAHLNPSNSNDSTSSSRGYVAHSVLEKEDGSLFAISPLLPGTAFAMGLISGMLTSGKRAGLVFMAENAHRLPDTVQGWYFYSKTKNYKVLLGAAKGGLRQGVRLGLWTTGFCFAERAAELTRSAVQEQLGTREGERKRVVGHWTDGAIAGVGTAAVATGLYRLPRASAVRVFQLGLLAGASTGGIRDLQERLVKEDIGGVASHT